MSDVDSDIMGFPLRFSSKLNQPDNPNTVVYLLNQLWKNIRISFECVDDDNGGFFVVHRSGNIILPPVLPEFTCLENLVIYLQELLEINGYTEYVVILHGQGDKDFEILTYDEFIDSLEYPKEEYLSALHRWGPNMQFDIREIIHPKISYPWVYVVPSVSEEFTSGGVEDLDPESICYKTSHIMN